MPRRSLILLGVLLAFAFAALVTGLVTSPAAKAQADKWPSKPVMVIVPFGAGGNADVLGRIYAERLSQRLDLRTMTITAVVVALALAVAGVTLSSGEFQIPVPEVIGALVWQATAKVQMVVVEWRLPRTSLALIMGAALGG